MGAKRSTSFRLTRESREKLARLSRRTGISQGSIVEAAIHFYEIMWDRKGVSIMAEVSSPQSNAELSQIHADLSAACAKLPPDAVAKAKPLIDQLGTHQQAVGSINWLSLIQQILAIILPALLPSPQATPPQASPPAA